MLLTAGGFAAALTDGRVAGRDEVRGRGLDLGAPDAPTAAFDATIAATREQLEQAIARAVVRFLTPDRIDRISSLFAAIITTGLVVAWIYVLGHLLQFDPLHPPLWLLAWIVLIGVYGTVRDRGDG